MRTRAAFAVLMGVVFVVPGAGDASAQSAGLGAGGSRGGAGLSAGGSAASAGFSQRSFAQPSNRSVQMPSLRGSLAVHSDTKRQPPVSRWESANPRPFAPGAAGLVPAGQGPTGEKSSLHPAPIPPPPAQRIVYRVNGGGWRYCHNDHRVVGVTIFTDGSIVARTGYNYDYVYEEHGSSSTATAIADMNSSTSSAPSSILPCEPQVVSLQGINYYLCGSQYYVQVYGIDGWMYVPVSSPTG